MNASAMGFSGSGRIGTTTAAPTGNAPNAIPYNAGNICVAPGGGTPRSWVAGLPYAVNGRMVIDTTGAAITGYIGGLALTAAGALAADTTGAIDHYVRGIPITAQGRLAIGVPV